MLNIPVNITLKEWEDYYGQFGRIISEHPYGGYFVHDNMDEGRWQLWHLTDYSVDSVTGGCIWLVKRG